MSDREKKEVVEKKSLEVTKNILELIKLETAGSPTDSSVKWTNLRNSKISELYEKKYSERISSRTVKRILKDNGFCKRRPNKALSTGKSPHRSEQFKLIFYFAFLFPEMGNNPILSIDTKKKERLGQLDRGGKVTCFESTKVFDHDYAHLSEGKVVPGGLYDMKENIGYVSIGTNYETAEFIGDSLIWWWDNFGINNYPDATHLLIFCDCGGANGYRHYAFKKKLLEVAKYIGIKIQVTHYPPYCSKWNPIEHRLFSQMHRAAEGCIFTSYSQVKQIYEQTSTKTGLTIFVRITNKQYQIGLKIKDKDLDNKRILKHPDLPQFNYTMLP